MISDSLGIFMLQKLSFAELYHRMPLQRLEKPENDLSFQSLNRQGKIFPGAVKTLLPQATKIVTPFKDGRDPIVDSSLNTLWCGIA